ncbi:hypothetical protein Stsp02_02450 [Streptomyces sp. NBRC 14336]|uniref:hypothetical protein n=1 Tax=unclassified Streptomyces TaxID=2593676 RepID=UPI0007F4DA8A|nr:MULTISPECIES: hypothetical protein [unclassified Streptomyces]MCM1973815.1 hypothetical protein [Streptomyces sp. G1]GLW44583.1 hypothetical protein Stsp02_02450 [Streptomyces sp. NBRC 14336]SBT91547.1 hypothetical protein GA0115233_103166 [Streptomyces sp. DI166]
MERLRSIRGTTNAAALATASLMLLTACAGGESEGGSASASPTPSASASASASAPKDEPPEEQAPVDLASAVLQPGDLAEFQISEIPDDKRDTPATKADPAACRPVENVRLEAFEPKPSTTVRRYALATAGEFRGTGTNITLASFGAADAEKILAELRTALKDCAKGYAGGALTFEEVRTLDAVDVGDEAVAFHLRGRGVQPQWYTVVRQGSVLVRFVSSASTGKDAPVPSPVVVQQVMKVQAAAAG